MPKKAASRSSKGKSKVHKVMKEHKQGKLKSGSGRKVTSSRQAVAIALNEARRSGAKIPKKKTASKGKKTASKGKKTASKKKSKSTARKK